MTHRSARELAARRRDRKDDGHFEAGKIRWRAELDKLGLTWVVPVSKHAPAELVRFRATQPALVRLLPFRTRDVACAKPNL